jgi:hypothetical protein
MRKKGREACIVVVPLAPVLTRGLPICGQRNSRIYRDRPGWRDPAKPVTLMVAMA